jgi:sugar lactone lactonase YvrE
LAHLNAPEAVVFDAYGDMFIADTGNNRIRMVSNGIITTVAGRFLTNREQGLDDNGNKVIAVGCTTSGCLTNNANGTPNFYTKAVTPYVSSCSNPKGAAIPVRSGGSNEACALVGDGKDPLSALLGAPSQMVVDANNDVIFVDRANARIRILTANPPVSGTAAFNGFSGINTLVGTGSNANTGDGGVGKQAGISTGTNGIAMNSTGVLFFTDRTNNRVRSFDTVGGIVGAYLGYNPPLFNNPTGIAVDASGNKYVADSGNNVIRKIDASGNVTIIAGSKTGGSASGEGIDPLTAALNNPTGIWVDPSGTLIYFADVGSNRIRKVSGGAITTVAGCTFTAVGSATPAQNCNFVSDGLPATITKINLSGGTTQNTKRFTGIAVDPSNGTIYFAQPGDQVLRKVANDGTLVTIAGQFGTSGVGGDGGAAVNMLISSPTGIAVDNAGNIIFAEGANFIAHIIAPNGIVYPLAGQPGQSAGDSEQTNNSGSIPVPAWGKRYRVIQGVAVDAQGNAYLVDSSNNKVDRIPYAAPAACIASASKTCTAATSTNTPLDTLLTDFRVIGDLGNTAGDFMFRYSAAASATAKGQTVQVSFPSGVAVDSNGNVFISDTANNMIREAVAPSK